MSEINTEKLLAKIEGAMKEGGVSAAMDICRDTRGPVASIFYQGLSRADQGIEVVEKSIASYGSVQMMELEKGFSWIQLFIAIAPMLGFLGTVIGMVEAFDAIELRETFPPLSLPAVSRLLLLLRCSVLSWLLFFNYYTTT